MQRPGNRDGSAVRRARTISRYSARLCENGDESTKKGKRQVPRTLAGRKSRLCRRNVATQRAAIGKEEKGKSRDNCSCRFHYQGFTNPGPLKTARQAHCWVCVGMCPF